MSVCSADSLDHLTDHLGKCASFNAISSYDNTPSSILNDQKFNMTNDHLYHHCPSSRMEEGIMSNNACYSKDDNLLNYVPQYAESHCLVKRLHASQLMRCKSDIINGRNASDSSSRSQQRSLHNYTDKVRSHIKVVKIRIPGKYNVSRYSYDGSAESSDMTDSSKIPSSPTESVLSSAQKEDVDLLCDEHINDKPVENVHHYSEDDTMYNVSFTQSDLSDWGKKGKANNSSRHIELKASDSDVDDFQNLLDDSSKQYRSIKSWLNDMSSAESSRKSRFSNSEVMATCQFNIKCLKEVRMNFENQSGFNGISLNQLDELIERWKMLESEINEKFKESKLLSKTLEELSNFRKAIDNDFKRVYEKNFRTPEELSARIDELEKYRIVLSGYKAEAESFITRLVRPFNEITNEELSIVRVSVKGLAKFIDKLAVNLRLVTHQMCNGLYRWNCFNGTLEKLKQLMNECVQETIAREENCCQLDISSKHLAIAAIQSRFKDFDFIETNLACIKSLLPEIATFCSEETQHELLGEVIYMKRRKDVISAWSSDLIGSLKNDDTSVTNSSRRLLYYRTLLSCLSVKNKDVNSDNSVLRSCDNTMVGNTSTIPGYNLNEGLDKGGQCEMMYRFSDGADMYRNYNYDFYTMDSDTHHSSSFKLYANTKYINSDVHSLPSTYIMENKAVSDQFDKRTAVGHNDLQKEGNIEASEGYIFHERSNEDKKTNDFTNFVETSKNLKSENQLYDTYRCETSSSKYDNDIRKHDFEAGNKEDLFDEQHDEANIASSHLRTNTTSSVSDSVKCGMPASLSTTSEELAKSASSNYAFEKEASHTGRISSDSISKNTSLVKHGDSGYQDSAGSFCAFDASLNSTHLANKCYLRKHKDNSKYTSDKNSLAIFKKGDKNASTCKRDIEYEQRKRAFANSKAKRLSRVNSSVRPTLERTCPLDCYQVNEEHNIHVTKDPVSSVISEHTNGTVKWWKRFIYFSIFATVLFICLTWNRSNHCDHISRNHFWSNCKYPSRFPPT